MKTLIYTLVFGVTFGQSATAAPQNCSLKLGYQVTVDFTVDMEAATLHTPMTGLLEGCQVQVLNEDDIAELKDFLNSPYTRDLLEKYEVIKQKIRDNKNLSDEQKEFFKLAAMSIEKAQKLVVGDRLLICSQIEDPLEVTWGKDLKTLDLYDNQRELLASYEATCSEAGQIQDPKN